MPRNLDNTNWDKPAFVFRDLVATVDDLFRQRATTKR